jgi:hypothetical protein
MNLGRNGAVIHEMSKVRTAPLANHALSVCDRCGSRVWLYSTVTGTRVALDDAPGPYILDANNAVFRTSGNDGYAGHSDRCSQIAAAPLSAPVDTDEMLWR